MKAIETITGPVSVLNRDDVDTDQIIPKQFLKRVERTGFGEFLFYDWAKEPDWDLPPNPILVAGRNFGCGSSREHAPWALEDYGFQAVIAPSFADIFRSNCTKIGLLPVQLTSEECAAIARGGPGSGRPGRSGGPLAGRPDGEVGTAHFEIDPEIKHRLLNGLDDIALTLEQDDADRRLRARPRAVGAGDERAVSGVSASGVVEAFSAHAADYDGAAPAAGPRLRRLLRRRASRCSTRRAGVRRAACSTSVPAPACSARWSPTPSRRREIELLDASEPMLALAQRAAGRRG